MPQDKFRRKVLLNTCHVTATISLSLFLLLTTAKGAFDIGGVCVLFRSSNEEAGSVGYEMRVGSTFVAEGLIPVYLGRHLGPSINNRNR